ncbi:hypothetical protein Vadar_015587 [Vaccinium darrowii]|uniref:Uncharacterized protein n=1 Tax=Vaccinium darrowii TaxID=229202 RepID=A0ACB7XAF6_9ERIC|nr:hypothetical protein Vadar_015587 [Vaccinium darrowii]
MTAISFMDWWVTRPRTYWKCYNGMTISLGNDVVNIYDQVLKLLNKNRKLYDQMPLIYLIIYINDIFPKRNGNAIVAFPAKVIGEAGSHYILENTKMENVYDYMFHLMNEYAKLLKFKPFVPETTIELCPEIMACLVDGVSRKFLEDSLEETPNDVPPCTLPPSYDPQVLKAFVEDKVRSTKQVEMWENEYWDKQNIQKQ